MEEAKHGVDYHDDGDDIGLPLLLLILIASGGIPGALLAYLMLALLR